MILSEAMYVREIADPPMTKTERWEQYTEGWRTEMPALLDNERAWVHDWKKVLQ